MFEYRHCSEGIRHSMAGFPNQDSSALIVSQNGLSVAVVADGIGQCALATEASGFVVERLSQMVCSVLLVDERMTDEYAGIAVRAGFASAFNGLVDLANRNEWALGELGTTLTCAVYDSRTARVFYGSIGDGGIVVLREDGSVEVITSVQKGENYSETLPVTEASAWEFGEVEGVVGLMVATDGVFDCLRALGTEPGGGRRASVVAKDIFDLVAERPIAEAASFLDSILYGVCEGAFSHVDDDKTLVMIVDEERAHAAVFGRRFLVADESEVRTLPAEVPDLAQAEKTHGRFLGFSGLLAKIKAISLQAPLRSGKGGKHAAR